MKISRLANWRDRFGDFARTRHSMPFAWGSNDCVMFAADAVLAITGIDLAIEHREGYCTELGAASLVHELGGLDRLVSLLLGDSLPAPFAQVGDVVLIPVDGRPSLAICNGAEVLAPSARGMSVQPLAHALRCWRVG